MSIFRIFFLLVALTSCTRPVIDEARRDASSTPREIVVTYQSTATEVGYQILNQGGNAFDAFVAATAVQYVLGPGVTSFAGPLGALLYDAKSKKTIFLDATFNQPLDPKQKFDPAQPRLGAAALVPGAVAGLEEISKKYGRLPFKTALQPAIQLAETGFPLDASYAGILASQYGRNLKRSPYATQTYFKNGKPLVKGEILKLPVVAKFIRTLAENGSDYVYRGAWAQKCVVEVNKQGGHLSLDDFSAYKPAWKSPAKISYRGYDILSSPNSGGLNTLLSLKVLEQTDILKRSANHYSLDADGLEALIRIQAQVTRQPWLYDEDSIRDSNFVQTKLTDSTAATLWKNVAARMQSPKAEASGTHSYQIVVIDSEGNAITGTNTIESFPWGNDIFVEGIPLTASGDLPFAAKAGERRRSPLSMQIGMKNEKVTFAVGAFSASLLQAELQFIVNIIDYHLPAQEAVSTPRFGSLAWDMNTRKVSDRVWLDPRIDASIVQALAQRGLKTIQDGYVDTGLGSVALVKDNGSVEGATAPMSSIGFKPPKSSGGK